MGELLRMEGVDKRFGSFYANRDVSLSIQEGEVHTLLGENGAGKSTLMNCLMGLYTPTAGKIFMHGKEVKIDSPRDAVEQGIGMVHQHFMLIEAMTGLENVILGTKMHTSPIMQRIEILKVLYRGANLLILDEPTAVLTDIEVEGLFDIMNSLTAEGKSIIFISHKMREVMRISDSITVLRAGRSIATVNINDTTEQELADLMIGREFTESYYEKHTSSDQPIMTLTHVALHPEIKHGGLKDVSLTIHAGEVLGVAGIDGNGQSQLAQVITGLVEPEKGEVETTEGKVALFSPQDFIDFGMANIPEDRNRMGLVGDMSIADNLILKQTTSERFSFGHGAWLRTDKIQQYAEDMREKNDIRCVSVNQSARSLSGGNQQKVILARELDGNPKLMVAVYPTRGLDIGATEFVHDSIIAQRDAGCAVLLISADFDEVLKLSDRIVVLFEGEIMGIYPGDNPPVKEISLAMAGQTGGQSRE